MKKLIGIFILVILSTISKAQITKAEFQASGLTCSMCSNAINKALKTVPFIAGIQTDLNKNIFSIVFVKNAAVDIDVIRKKVEDAGFSIAKLWITVDMQNAKIENETHLAAAGLNFHFIDVKPQVLKAGQRLQVIDKNFISAREFKKFSAYTKMPCYQTGLIAACCPPQTNSIGATGRIVHVTL